MSEFRVLVGECPPGKDCPKVARSAPGMVAIVGVQITDPKALAALGVGPGEAAVEITESMYREAAEVMVEVNAGAV